MIQRIKKFFTRNAQPELPTADVNIEQFTRYEYNGELREKATRYMCYVFDNPQAPREPSDVAMSFAMSIITGTRIPVETLNEKRTILIKE